MKKSNLNEKLKKQLLPLSMAEFEKAIGFSEEDWRNVKEGLSQRESGKSATLKAMAPGFTVKMLQSDGAFAGENVDERIEEGGADFIGDQVSLGDYSGRPLALVLGCYTCPVFRRHTGEIKSIYHAFKDSVSFLHVYVYEMHPVDGWFVPANLVDDVIYDQPVSEAGRIAIARDWVEAQGIEMPVALDDMSNSVDALYSGSPERLYVVDAQGVVQFVSAEGPFDDEEVGKWRQAIEALAR